MFRSNTTGLDYETIFEDRPAAEYNIRELYEEYIDDPRFIDISNMINNMNHGTIIQDLKL